MADKKKTLAEKVAPPAEKVVTAPDEPKASTVVGGIAAEDLEILKQPIDKRMAALLKDHKEMGAR